MRVNSVVEKEYPYPGEEGPVKWVSTGWLLEHLKKDVQILDCQPNVHEYIQDHIPGAIYLPEGIFRAHGQLPTSWVPPGSVRETLRTAGIRPELPKVIYTSRGPLTTCSAFIGDGLEQTMVAYSLARYGLDKIYLLDGGWEKWKAEGNPLTHVLPPPRSASTIAVTHRKHWNIGIDEVKHKKDQADTVLLDARPVKFYEGQGPWIRPGHIPGAVSLPWVTLMDDNNRMLLKPDDQILASLKAHGVTHDKTIITSCGTGREATNEFLLLKFYLGYPDVRLYEGGFTEWTADPANPVATGPNPG